MRRVLAFMLTMVCGFAVVVPGASAAPLAAQRIQVDGALAGPGGFRSEGCGNIVEFGYGSFHAPDLGHGIYQFSVCVTVTGTITFDGTITLTIAHGAKLTGDIGGTYSGGGPTFDVTITGGTKKFAHARGALTVGPLAESNRRNCDPRTGLCWDWDDSGPITGTVTHVG
jgi:hypothetical protein